MLLVLSAAEELARQQPMKQPQKAFLVRSQQACKLFFLKLFIFVPGGASFRNSLYVKKSTILEQYLTGKGCFA